MIATGRAFPLRPVIGRDGKALRMAQIVCSKCGHINHHQRPRNANNEASEKYFRSFGWLVGKNSKEDICKRCFTEAKDTEMQGALKAEAPREMTRDERRIISSKLDEVYKDEKTGYLSPWTDSAVAKDLGVPRAWVSEVREAFFGPDNVNPQLQAFLDAAAPIIAETKNLFAAARGQLDQAKALEGRIEELERMSRKIEKEIGR